MTVAVAIRKITPNSGCFQSTIGTAMSSGTTSSTGWIPAIIPQRTAPKDAATRMARARRAPALWNVDCRELRSRMSICVLANGRVRNGENYDEAHG